MSTGIHTFAACLRNRHRKMLHLYKEKRINKTPINMTLHTEKKYFFFFLDKNKLWMTLMTVLFHFLWFLKQEGKNRGMYPSITNFFFSTSNLMHVCLFFERIIDTVYFKYLSRIWHINLFSIYKISSQAGGFFSKFKMPFSKSANNWIIEIFRNMYFTWMWYTYMKFIIKSNI